jgi:hypothetical protein
MAMNIRQNGLVRATAFALGGLLSAMPALASPAGDEAPEPVSVPHAELRAFGGTVVGAGLAGSFFDHRVRLELSDGWIPGKTNGHDTEAAAMVRVAGTSAKGVWVRGGFQRIARTWTCYDRPNQDDEAMAFDVGGAYRARSRSGHLFVAELGWETLRRDQRISCNDSGVDARSGGVRFGVLGQLSLGGGVGVFGRVGVRTADHILEIGVLPELFGGLAFEL